MIGETQVGKTSLLQRFLLGPNCSNPSETVAAVFHPHERIIDDRKIVLQLWDTAGQERFRSLGPIYYRGAHAAIAVFDLTRPATLNALENWIHIFRENADGQYVIVVGNKSDLESEIQFDMQATSDWAARRGAECIWTSSVTGLGIDEVFNAVYKQMAADPTGMTLFNAKQSGCC
jgi:small GTP-binding protein